MDYGIMFLQQTVVHSKSHKHFLIFDRNPKKKKSLFASVSVLYYILNDHLIDISLHSYCYNKQKSTKEHINFLPAILNTVLLFDRG